MASYDDLKECVLYAIEKIRQRVKQTRNTHPKKKHRVQDYPAMVVACGYARGRVIFYGESASPVNHQYEPKIEGRLSALGPIGKSRMDCDNIIGACAEPHAANKVLKNYPGCRMDELQFSQAYRPRTAQKKKYCKNCKDTFYEVL